MAPLQVALLTPCYWPEVRRGTERFARDLGDGLLLRGHAPTLITSHRGLPRRAEEAGLPVLRLPRPPHRYLVGRGYESYVTHVPFSYLALRRGNYDLAHALYPSDGLAAGRWGRRTGRPTVLTYMGVPETTWLDARHGRRRILERAVASCDAVVVLSRHAADVLRQSLDHNPHVIAPGVDLDAFVPTAQRSATPTIICPAVPDEPRKNVALLIEAFSLVRGRHRDASLILSRPRNRRPTGIPADVPGVRWLDLDDRATLARAYAEAWVGVLPSVGEAFGLVLVEALACGTPVVGYGHAAIPEIIDRPQVGRVFDQLTPQALADALLKTLPMAEDPATVAACRARAEDFSTDRCTESYLAVYDHLLGSAVGRIPPTGQPARV